MNASSTLLLRWATFLPIDQQTVRSCPSPSGTWDPTHPRQHRARGAEPDGNEGGHGSDFDLVPPLKDSTTLAITVDTDLPGTGTATMQQR